MKEGEEMPDMLVKLYDLFADNAVRKNLVLPGVEIRRAMPPEKHIVLAWIKKQFGAVWASECDVAFSNTPISCFLAVRHGSLIGFSCYDASCLNFFGPTGVLPTERGVGIGRSLLLESLWAMKEQGYAYAIIGAAGPIDFYKRTVNATVIEGSEPGIYRGVLKEP